MSNNNPINEKKKALLAYKGKILEEMQYYDKRIEEFRTNHRNNCYYDDSDSSDSEDYFPNIVDTGPEVPQLKAEQSLLKTCLQATQELTNLTILQSEINVLVQDPQLDGEKPVTEPGTWQEVTAECRIDLVPFTIAFYMHTPNRKFGPTSYRGLQLSLVKASHEVELNNSVLHTLKRPSDAVEVVRSYAVSHRSRRTTLARLANKYASSLFMETHPDGGFVLKCANLLEILWRLENKWSPVAPFHHRMKFDLEYMDESYIKTITQAHKQLLDPAIQTDERTLLLSKIINTCLEARGPVDSDSDLESKQTDVQTETDPKNEDSEVMAPPKSLPKKTKKMTAKDKKTNADVPKEKSVPQKRSMEDENEGGKAKKVKTTENSNSATKKLVKSKEKSGEKKKDDAKKINNDGDNELVKKKSNENVGKQINKKSNQNHQIENISKINIDNGNENNKNTANIAKKTKNNANVPEVTKINKKDNKELKKTKSNEELKRKNVETGESEPKKVKSTSDINKNDEQIFDSKKADNETNNLKRKIQKNSKEKKNDDIENKESEHIEATITNANEKPKDNKNNEVPPQKIDKKSKMAIANDKKFDLITKKISDIENKNLNKTTKNIKKDNLKTVTTSKNANVNKKPEFVTDKQSEKENTKNIEKKTADIPKNAGSQNNVNKQKLTETVKNMNSGHTKGLQTVKTFTEKNANNIKNKERIINVNKVVTEKIIKDKPTTSFNKPEKIVNSSSTPKNGVMDKKLPKITTKSVRNIIHKSPNPKYSIKVQNSQKSIKPKISNDNIQVFSGNSEKENGDKISKIPQKKMFSNEKILKTNILRISPRRLPSKFKPISQDTNPKQLTKTTNIPRFMKKTVPKVSK